MFPETLFTFFRWKKILFLVEKSFIRCKWKRKINQLQVTGAACGHRHAAGIIHQPRQHPHSWTAGSAARVVGTLGDEKCYRRCKPPHLQLDGNIECAACSIVLLSQRRSLLRRRLCHSCWSPWVWGQFFGTVKLVVVCPTLDQSSVICPVQAQDTTGEHATLQSQRVQAVEGGGAGPLPHLSTPETIAIQKSLLCKEPEGVKFVSWIQKPEVSHAEALLCHGTLHSTLPTVLSSLFCP